MILRVVLCSERSWFIFLGAFSTSSVNPPLSFSIPMLNFSQYHISPPHVRFQLVSYFTERVAISITSTLRRVILSSLTVISTCCAVFTNSLKVTEKHRRRHWNCALNEHCMDTNTCLYDMHFCTFHLKGNYFFWVRLHKNLNSFLFSQMK